MARGTEHFIGATPVYKTSLACRIGWHAWDKWTPLPALTRRFAYGLKYFQETTCKKCGLYKVKESNT